MMGNSIEDEQMPITTAWALLRRNEDGLTRRYKFEMMPNEDDDRSGNMWSKGEYSCDCNRALLFSVAEGEEMSGHPCGDKLFSVRIEDASGSAMYQDASWCVS